MAKRRLIEVQGVVIRGHGVASGQTADQRFPAGTIRAQVPHFRARGLDLTALYPGTINVSIAPAMLHLRQPKLRFRGVDWTDHFPPEDFSFSPCAVRFAGTRHEGFIYYPHPETKPEHFQSPSTVEIMTTWIPDLVYGSEVALEFDPSEVFITGDP